MIIKSKKISYIFIILYYVSLLPLISFAQEPAKLFSITGNVKILIGLDLLPAKSRLIVLKGQSTVTEADSLGNFYFENLEPNSYKIQVIGENSNTIDTTFTVINQSIDNFNLVTTADCGISAEIAYRDLEANTPQLLLKGGIAPIRYGNEEQFENRFSVKYNDFGDTGPVDECVLQYNQVIFKYLDTKYGRRWRRSVRKDVIGL